MTDPKEFAINYLIHCQYKIKELVQPFEDIRDNLLKIEDRVFHDEILKQYKDVIKWTIVKDIVQNVKGVSTEDALIVVESMENLEDYLKL